MRVKAIFFSSDGRLRPAWRALVFVPVLVALLYSSVTLVTLLVSRERLLADRELALLIGGLCTSFSAALAAYLLLQLLDRRSFRNLGLWFYAGWARELGTGLLGGLGLLSVAVGLLWLAGQVQFRSVGLLAPGVLHGLGWNLALLLPPAAAEELVFRGYPFQRLVEAWGRFVALFLFSAGFGLGHLHNPAATPLSTVNTVLMGVLLALAYLKTRGLWLPIGLHFAWNFSLGFLYALPVSGIVLSHKLLAVEIGERTWLSGGNYGPEGSVLTTGVVLGATVWLARTRRLGVSPALAKELQ